MNHQGRRGCLRFDTRLRLESRAHDTGFTRASIESRAHDTRFTFESRTHGTRFSFESRARHELRKPTSHWRAGNVHARENGTRLATRVEGECELRVATLDGASGDALDERGLQCDVELDQSAQDVHQELHVVGVAEKRHGVVHVGGGGARGQHFEPVVQQVVACAQAHEQLELREAMECGSTVASSFCNFPLSSLKTTSYNTQQLKECVQNFKPLALLKVKFQVK